MGKKWWLCRVARIYYQQSKCADRQRAIRDLEAGLASAEDIDKAVSWA